MSQNPEELAPPVQVAIGADVTSFISTMREAVTAAQAEMEKLDTKQVEARMDATLRKLADQAVAYGHQYEMSIDQVIKKLEANLIIQDTMAAKMRLYMNQAAKSAGVLTQPEALNVLVKQVDAAITNAANRLTQGGKTEFADMIPLDEIKAINAEMNASVLESAQMFSETWGVAVSDVLGALRAEFSVLDEGLTSLIGKKPGTVLSEDLAKVVPASKGVEAEISKIDGLINNLAAAKTMGPSTAMNVFKKQIAEASAVTGIRTAGKSSGQLFDPESDANRMSLIDKMINRLEAIKNAYINIGKASATARAQVEDMPLGDVLQSGSMTLVNAKMEQTQEIIGETTSKINEMHREMNAAPGSEGVKGYEREIERLQTEVKSLNVDLENLKLASRRIAAGGTPTSVMSEALQGTAIHPSSILSTPEQLKGRALEQVLGNAGIADVEAYISAFVASSSSNTKDLGSEHGKKMHARVGAALEKSVDKTSNEFERSFNTSWKGIPLTGRFDWVDHANRVITDFKAISPEQFAQLDAAIKSGNFKEMPIHLKKYVAQLEEYGRAMKEMTGQDYQLRFARLTSRGEIGTGPGKEYQTIQGAATANARSFTQGERMSASWRTGGIINDQEFEQLLDEAKANLAQAMMDPEVQLRKDLAIEAQELAKQEALAQKEVNAALKEQVVEEQQATAAAEERVTAKEEWAAAASGAGAPPIVPPTAPPATAAPLPPEDESKWDKLAQGKTLEEQYVLSLNEEAMMQEKVAEALRKKAALQGKLVEEQRKMESFAGRGDLTEDEKLESLRISRQNQDVRETLIRQAGREADQEQTSLRTQQARTKELRAQLNLQASEKKTSAGAITAPEFTKLSDISKKLAEASVAGQKKEVKSLTAELEQQLKVVDVMIARKNDELVKAKAVSEQSSAQLTLEKERLNVLEREAALKQNEYVSAAKQGGAGTPQGMEMEVQAAQAQRAVTAQQQLVTATEMKVRADEQATAGVQANVAAMRQQATAAETTKKAFGDAGEATKEWASKVFSLRHITSSFFGMMLSMIGYGIFGKVQEGLQSLTNESKRGEEAVYALEGAIKATQERAAEGVSFKVDAGTTVEQFIGGRQEMLKWVEEFRQEFAGVWSTADIEEAAANVMNLTRGLEMTKEQFRELMKLSGVFSVIDAGYSKEQDSLLKGSEYLARIVQGNIKNTAITAIGHIEPQMQAEKARQLGLQKEWEQFNKLSGAEASHIQMLVNLAIINDKMNGRQDEINKRLGTTALRYKQIGAAQEEFGQTSRVAYEVNQSALNLGELLNDIIEPKNTKQLTVRAIGIVRSEFEQEIKEGKFGDLSDEMYNQLTARLEQVASEHANKAIYTNIFGNAQVDWSQVNAFEIMDQLRKEFEDALKNKPFNMTDWINNSIAQVQEVKYKVQLPEIDFPSMTDQLTDLEETRLEDRANALGDYFKGLKEKGQKYADDLVQFLRDHNEKIVEIEHNLGEKLEDIRINNLEKIADAQRDLADKLAQIEEDRRNDEIKKAEDKNNDYLEAQIDYQRKLEDIAIEHFRRLKDINDQYLFDLDEAANQRNARQALQLMRKNKFDIAQENESNQQRIEDAARDYARKLEDIERKQNQEAEQRKKDYDKQIADAKEAYEKKLAEIERERQKDVAAAVSDRDKARKKEDEEYEAKKQKRTAQLADEYKQVAKALQDKLDQIDENIDDQLRKIARGWQKKYKLDGDQLKLAYDQLKAYYGPGGYFQQVMDWWTQYVNKVPTIPDTTTPTQPVQPMTNPPFNYQVNPGTTPNNPLPQGNPITTPDDVSHFRMTNTNNNTWSGTRTLEVKVTADEHFSQDFEEKVLGVMTEAIDAVRS